MHRDERVTFEGVLAPTEGTFEMVAGLWSVYLGKAVTKKDVENMLAMVAMTRGVSVRPLESLPEHPLVSEFWRLVNEGEAKGECLNRSENPHEIVLRMPLVKRVLVRSGWSDAQVNAVKKLLPFYSPYRLLRKNAVMHDKLDKVTRRCWVFKCPSKED